MLPCSSAYGATRQASEDNMKLLMGFDLVGCSEAIKQNIRSRVLPLAAGEFL